MEDNVNPYRPPESDVSSLPASDCQSARLYKVGHIGMATFFGSAAAGFVLMALNDRAFGRPAASRNMILTGIAAMVAIFIAGYFIPENIPAIPINLAVVVGVVKYAQFKQGALLKEYLENGATLHSGWRAFGISLICILVLMIVIAVIVFVAITVDPDSFPD